MDDAVVLVASPRYLEENGPVDGPEDVLHLTRIIDTTSENDESTINWRSWFHHHGLPEADHIKSIRFNGSVLTLEAASSGLGISLARYTLAQDDLRSGRLERLAGCDSPTDWSHYALVLPELADWPPVVAFLGWLRDEAKR